MCLAMDDDFQLGQDCQNRLDEVEVISAIALKEEINKISWSASFYQAEVRSCGITLVGRLQSVYEQICL